MRVLYLSNIHFSDVDMSLMPELMLQFDAYYIMEINSRVLSSCAVNINKPYRQAGLYSSSVYPELSKFEKLFNQSRFFVLNFLRDNKILTMLSILKNEWQLFRFIKKNKFDVIHSIGEPYKYRSWIYLFRNKMIISRHDPVFHSGTILTRAFKASLNRAFKYCNRFMIYNESQRKDFVKQFGLKDKKVCVSRLGIYSYLHIYKDSIPPRNSNYILFFGRISKYKGIKYLLDAMMMIHQECPDLNLIIAGKGDFDFDITKYEHLPYIQIENRYIDDRELSALICNCKFIVCPYTDATQSGVLMSSFAWNKTAIVTSVGGLPEVVGHGRYGVIIPPKDVNALANAVVSLVNNPNQISVFEKRIHDEYSSGANSWLSIIKQYKEFYK